MTRSPPFGAELDTVVDPSPKTVAGVLRRADEWQAPGPSRLGRARSPTDEVSVGLLIRRHDDASGGPDGRQPPITIRCTHPDPAGWTGCALPPCSLLGQQQPGPPGPPQPPPCRPIS